MTQNANGPQVLESPRDREDLAGGEASAKVPQPDPPRVLGRLDTYRSRNKHWHGQVRVERCPGCGHPHLHRAPMARVPDVLKNAPCGLAYVVVLVGQGVVA